ncbi:unnamed protein product, partial [Amoebophrya sp. A25]
RPSKLAQSLGALRELRLAARRKSKADMAEAMKLSREEDMSKHFNATNMQLLFFGDPSTNEVKEETSNLLGGIAADSDNELPTVSSNIQQGGLLRGTG